MEQDPRSQWAGLLDDEVEPQERADTRFADPNLGLEALREEQFYARHHLLAPALARLKAKTRELRRRARGRSPEQIIKAFFIYLIGGPSYFSFCQTQSVLHSLDNWLRRRLRTVAWKQRKCGLTSSRPKIRSGKPVPSPLGRRQKLSVLLLIIAGVTLAVSLKALTRGSIATEPVNIEARGPVPPHNGVKSSTATAMRSPPSADQPYQPTNARKPSAARTMATLSLPPLPRDRPMIKTGSKRKDPRHTTTRSLPRDNDKIGQMIAKTVKSSAATASRLHGLTPAVAAKIDAALRRTANVGK